jgi:hypothetical protein
LVRSPLDRPNVGLLGWITGRGMSPRKYNHDVMVRFAPLLSTGGVITQRLLSPSMFPPSYRARGRLGFSRWHAWQGSTTSVR